VVSLALLAAHSLLQKINTAASFSVRTMPSEASLSRLANMILETCK